MSPVAYIDRVRRALRCRRTTPDFPRRALTLVGWTSARRYPGGVDTPAPTKIKRSVARKEDEQHGRGIRATSTLIAGKRAALRALEMLIAVDLGESYQHLLGTYLRLIYELSTGYQHINFIRFIRLRKINLIFSPAILILTCKYIRIKYNIKYIE